MRNLNEIFNDMENLEDIKDLITSFEYLNRSNSLKKEYELVKIIINNNNYNNNNNNNNNNNFDYYYENMIMF